jgi:hypothetical protein
MVANLRSVRWSGAVDLVSKPVCYIVISECLVFMPAESLRDLIYYTLASKLISLATLQVTAKLLVLNVVP